MSPRGPDDRTFLHAFVFCDQERGLQNRGRRNQTVCGVAREERRQFCGFYGNGWRDCEEIDARKRQSVNQPLERGPIEGDSVSACQRGHLHTTDCRDADLFRTMNLPLRNSSQLGRFAHPPNPCVGVQDDQRSASQASRMGPTISPFTMTLPRRDLAFRTCTGTTSTTGRPRLVTMKDSRVLST